jgi:hypothetical protein
MFPFEVKIRHEERLHYNTNLTKNSLRWGKRKGGKKFYIHLYLHPQTPLDRTHNLCTIYKDTVPAVMLLNITLYPTDTLRHLKESNVS